MKVRSLLSMIGAFTLIGGTILSLGITVPQQQALSQSEHCQSLIEVLKDAKAALRELEEWRSNNQAAADPHTLEANAASIAAQRKFIGEVEAELATCDAPNPEPSPEPSPSPDPSPSPSPSPTPSPGPSAEEDRRRAADLAYWQQRLQEFRGEQNVIRALRANTAEVVDKLVRLQNEVNVMGQDLLREHADLDTQVERVYALGAKVDTLAALYLKTKKSMSDDDAILRRMVGKEPKTATATVAGKARDQLAAAAAPGSLIVQLIDHYSGASEAIARSNESSIEFLAQFAQRNGQQIVAYRRIIDQYDALDRALQMDIDNAERRIRELSK